MKILHIANVTRIGGIERVVQDLVEAQIANGLSSAIQAPLFLKHTKYINKNFQNGIFKSGFDISIIHIYKQKEFFKNYDILHFHGFGFGLFISAILSRRKLIYTEHGTFQKANQKKNLLVFIKKRILGYFFLNNFFHAVIFVSYWLQNNVKLNTSRQTVIYNGTNFIVHQSNPSNKCYDKTTTIMYVGRMVIRKRIDRLIKAVSFLPQDGQFKLICVGEGSQRVNLEKQCSNSLSHNIFIFCNFSKDISSIYKKAQILVLPTQFEPFGLVVLEAIACGLIPLIFHDAGGTLEIVSDLKENLIAANEKHMAELILFWGKNHSLRIKRISQLQQLINDKFSISRMEKNYFQLYQKVIQAD